MSELRQAIKNDTLFDYIANNYYNMSKEELATICKELIWAATSRLSDDDRAAFYQEVLNNLEED